MISAKWAHISLTKSTFKKNKTILDVQKQQASGHHGAHILQGLLMNQLISVGGVCRTAPATPGLGQGCLPCFKS